MNPSDLKLGCFFNLTKQQNFDIADETYLFQTLMFPPNMVGNFHSFLTTSTNQIQGGPEARIPSMLLAIIFVDFMEKEPLTKFCAILITFQEVMKLVFNI